MRVKVLRKTGDAHLQICFVFMIDNGFGGNVQSCGCSVEHAPFAAGSLQYFPQVKRTGSDAL